MSNSSNLFAGVKDAKFSERGAFCNPGLYKVRIKRVVLKHTRKNYDAFIVEFTVVESSYLSAKADAVKTMGDRPYDANVLEKTLPNKVGTTASWFQSLQDQDIGFGALKGFAANITGQKPDDVDFLKEVEGFLTDATTKGALDGALVPLEVVEIQTKKGTPFSLYKWGEMVDEGPAATGAGAGPAATGTATP